MAKKRKKKRKGGSAAARSGAADTPAPEVTPQASPHTPEAPAPSEAPRRGPANLFIGLFLLYSLAMPAHYYLSDRTMDERFAWRMFSTVRQHRCTVDVTETRRDRNFAVPVHMQRALHVAWIKLLKRGRPAVSDKFLRARCEAEDNRDVTLERTCVAPVGTKVPTVRYAIDCDSGTITETREDSS